MNFESLDLVIAFFRPARVHAHQHRGPILAFRAPRAGMDFKVGVITVSLAGQQRLDLATFGSALQFAQRFFRLSEDFTVVLCLGQFDQIDLVGTVQLPVVRLTGSVRPVAAAGASGSEPCPARSTVPDLPPPRSDLQGAPWPHPSQRCLLSRATACSISLTMFWIFDFHAGIPLARAGGER